MIEEGAARLRPRSIANLLSSLLIVVRGFAPSQNWSWLAHAAQTMLMRSMPHQLKPPLPITAPELFGWAKSRLCALEQGCEPPNLRIAAQYRVALSIGFLIAVPVRARSFIAMTVNRHVETAADGIKLHFPSEDVKTRVEMRFALPELLVPHFRRYLDVYRPFLLNGRECNSLWISERGNRLSQDSLTSGLACATQKAFGLVLRPHAFRHIAATSIAEYAPEHVGIIRDILGHVSLRMAEQHYNRATAISSSHRMQGILRQLRKRSRHVRLLSMQS
jgi:integrase